MRNIKGVCGLAAAVLVAGVAGCGGGADEVLPSLETVEKTNAAAMSLGFAPDLVVLKLTPKLGGALRAHLDEGQGIDAFAFPDGMAAANGLYGASQFAPLFPEEMGDEALRERLTQLHKSGYGVDPNAALYQLENVFVVTLAAGSAVVRAAADYQLTGDAVWAEPVAIAQPAYLPNDPLYAQQWGPQRIQCDAAWDSVSGGGTTIAIIDSGIDASHPDLAGQIWINGAEAGGTPNFDDDNNGYDDDIYGWDYTLGQGSSLPVDGLGHGTLVAGIAGAVADNVGIIGVAHGTQLMNLRIFDNNGNAHHTDIAAAIAYAANAGASVINASVSVIIPSQLIEDAVKTAHLLGVPVVAAAGNHPMPAIESSPANIEWATTVGASTSLDAYAYYSNFGVKLDVAAPGGDGISGDILTTQSGGGYSTTNGTSMAAPHVAGLYALLREAAPGWSVEQLRQTILTQAQDIESAGFDTLTGHGRVDVTLSVAEILNGLSKPTPTANVVVPPNGGHVTTTMNVEGYADVTPATNGSYTLDWAPSLAGPWTSFGGGNISGGAAPGLTTLGSISPLLFPASGNYIIRQQTTDAYLRTSTDYNEIEVCGSCTPSLSNLVSRWKFEPANGTSTPDAISINHGHYLDDAGSSPFGRVGHAASFFGNNDRMIAHDVTQAQNLTMAVAAWIKPATFHKGVIASWHTSAIGQWELGFEQNTIYFRTCQFGNCPTFYASAVMINTMRWTHVVAVIEPFLTGQITQYRLRLYIDGALNPTCTGSACTLVPNVYLPGANPQYTVGGGSHLGTGSFEGQLDEVEIYSGPISAADVAAIFGAGCAGSC